MKKRSNGWKIIALYCLILFSLPAFAAGGSELITAFAEGRPLERGKIVIIDAGHGGVDGGATSCTGVLESQINLDIALKLDDLLHLLGIQTKMIRKTDISIYTNAKTIAEKKVSDLKERVRIVNEADDAILISIHQNHFSDPQYRGAQIFYTETKESETLAKELQTALNGTLDPHNSRQAKKAAGVYLMQHIEKTGVLIECGFLSNPEEEALLRNDAYQRKLCVVIATNLCRYLANT